MNEKCTKGQKGFSRVWLEKRAFYRIDVVKPILCDIVYFSLHPALK